MATLSVPHDDPSTGQNPGEMLSLSQESSAHSRRTSDEIARPCSDELLQKLENDAKVYEAERETGLFPIKYTKLDSTAYAKLVDEDEALLYSDEIAAATSFAENPELDHYRPVVRNLCGGCERTLSRILDEEDILEKAAGQYPSWHDFPLHVRMEDWLTAVRQKCPLCTRVWHDVLVEGWGSAVAVGTLGSSFKMIEAEVFAAALFEVYIPPDASEDCALKLNLSLTGFEEDLMAGTFYWTVGQFELERFLESANRSIGASDAAALIVDSPPVPPPFRILPVQTANDESRAGNSNGDELRTNDDNSIESKLQSTGSDAVLRLAAHWLNSCHTHRRCIPTDQTTWLPRRLLDVESPNDPFTFRVVEVEEANLKGVRYMTLSHCWGTSDFLKLTKLTRAALYTGMKVSRLAQTFQDAIYVCRFMAIRYLWIDSLCIIQDDKQDWAEQSMKMSAVYRNSYCNIAAAASEDSSQGVFRSRSIQRLESMWPCLLKGLRPSEPKTCHRILFEGQWERLDSSPLSKRAWVYQERLLSNRTLHFGSEELLWECGSHRLSETFSTPNRDARTGFNTIDIRSLSSEEKNCSESCRLCPMWTDIMKVFSKLRLSHVDDRPLAIVGLASQIREQTGRRYLAGLWDGHLAQQLDWFVEMHDPDPSAKPLRIMPSFTWLSLETSIDARLRSYKKSLIQVLSAEVGDIIASEETNIDETKMIQTGKLTVRGLLLSVRLIRSPRVHGYGWDLIVPSFGPTAFCVENYPDWTRCDLPIASKGREHYVLPLIISSTVRTMAMLVMEAVCEQEKTFRRIGYVSLSPNDTEHDRAFLDALSLATRFDTYRYTQDWHNDPACVEFDFV